MVCVGKNIANCSKNPQFLPVMYVLCTRCADTPPLALPPRGSTAPPAPCPRNILASLSFGRNCYWLVNCWRMKKSSK